MLGTRDYVEKNGFRHVVIGLSGGIDSTLVALVAVDALGADQVTTVTMPSPYSSSGTLGDAHALARNLGVEILEVPIEPMMGGYDDALREPFAGREPDIAEENLQARIRGNLLMALSNKFGWLVLTTGNKSELAVGYSTLYGDSAGGFAVIKDVPKTLVYELDRAARPARGRRARPAGDRHARAVGGAAPRPARRRLPAAVRDPRPHPRGLRRARPRAASSSSRAACRRRTSTASSGSSTSPSTSAARTRRGSRSPPRRSAATAACRSPTATAAESPRAAGDRCASAAYRAAAMTALAQLPADQQAVLDLVLRRGRSYAGIARALRLDVDAVRARARDAVSDPRRPRPRPSPTIAARRSPTGCSARPSPHAAERARRYLASAPRAGAPGRARAADSSAAPPRRASPPSRRSPSSARRAGRCRRSPGSSRSRSPPSPSSASRSSSAARTSRPPSPTTPTPPPSRARGSRPPAPAPTPTAPPRSSAAAARSRSSSPPAACPGAPRRAAYTVWLTNGGRRDATYVATLRTDDSGRIDGLVAAEGRPDALPRGARHPPAQHRHAHPSGSGRAARAR